MRLLRPLAAAGLAALTTLAPASASAQQTEEELPPPFASDARPLFLPPQSVADPGGADAILFNPAALELEPGGEFVLVHSDRFDRNLPGDGNALFWKTGGFLNLGIEWARPADDVQVRLFSFGSSIPIGRATALGASYVTSFGGRFSDVEYEDWTAGFLTRPTRWTSLGATVWNVRNDDREGLPLAARYAGGFALRPLGNDRLTLGADVAKTDGQRGEDLRFSLRAEPVRGVGIYATADEEERWTAGLTLSFTYGDAGGHAFTDEEGEVLGTSTRIRMRQRRRPTVLRMGKSYARVPIEGPLPDRSEETLFAAAEATLPHVLDTLARVRRDPTMDGVLLRIESAGDGLASAQELRHAILETRAADKKVFCYFDNADLRRYYVAAACDEIAMNPAGMLSIEGFATGLGYLKGTLERIGVTVDVARVGEYKGAPETFLRTDPSEETLEVTNALLDGAFAQAVDGIAKGRELDPSQVRTLIDGAFYTADAALEQKLVDHVFYADELEEKAKDSLGGRIAVVRGYRGVAPAPDEWGAPPRIAVVYASGPITEGESRPAGLFSGPVLGSDTIVRALRHAKGDPSVEAVVLRVDSPGGSGFASDEIWHEVLNVKKRKPVVVSMGDVAASGGYYVSMGANEIFALPGTITGSIGVFFLKPSLQGLYEKIDYERYDYSRGAYAGMFTEARPFTDQERLVAERLVNEFYRDFIEKAAKGRDTTVEAIDAVGRGHVWLGSRAVELKLVDREGGFEQALARAKELAKIPAHRRVELLELPSARGFFEELAAADGAPGIRAAAARIPFAQELARLELARTLGPGVAAWLPVEALRSRAAPRSVPVERGLPDSRWTRWWPITRP